MKTVLSVLFISLFSFTVFAQKHGRPYRCGFVLKDFKSLKQNYERYGKRFGVRSGEQVASVGASSGYVEAQLSCFTDSVHWTLQDIDTICLNKSELRKVMDYYEQLSNKTFHSTFEIVKGTETKTNLEPGKYDRLLMLNVYHELSDPQPVMHDVYAALKTNGFLVILERMATKPGQRHGDCKKPRLWEPDFLKALSESGFSMVKKESPNPGMYIYFFSKMLK